MIDYIFESSVSFLDSVICVYFLMKSNGSSWHKSKYAIPTIILYFIVTLIGDYIMPNFNVITTCVLFLISLLYAFSIYRKFCVHAVITACIYKMAFILLSSLAFTVLSFFFDDLNNLLYGSGNIARYIFVIIHKIALFSVLKFSIHLFNRNLRWEMKNGIYSMIISFVTILGLGTTMVIAISPESTNYQTQILLIISAFVLINIIVYFLISQIQRLQESKFELRLLKEKMIFEEERHKDVSRIWNNTRQMQHDIKQHLTVILSQLESCNFDECRTYINHLLPSIEHMETLIKSGNTVLDYLINSKLGVLKNTQVHVSGVIGDFSDIRESDLACLVGNILDNAIEATEYIEDKRIELIFTIQNSNRILICKNTVKDSVLKHNRELISTKSEYDGHGLGHIIIAKIVNDYNGIVDYFEEGNMFGIEIILPEPSNMRTRE